jgi:membrane protein
MLAPLHRINRFIRTDVWRINTETLPRWRAWLVRTLQVLFISVFKFEKDQCSLRASALTLYTLLSIVPMLAMVFGIAQGFGLETAIQTQLIEKLQGQEEVAKWMIDFAYSLLSTTKGGLIAGVGVLVLLWTVIQVVKNIEISFNAIWKVDKLRGFTRTITDYLAIMLIAPMLFIVSSSLTVAIARKIKFISSQVHLIGFISSGLFWLLQLLPYGVISLLFTFIYIAMPNAKVNTTSGLVGGLIAGTMYQIFQWIYIGFQVGVSKYNTIYGSFAALPLFIIYLQFSWLIVLFGAEICYAYQQGAGTDLTGDPSRVSQFVKRLLTLTILRTIVKEFQQGEHRCTSAHLARVAQVPRAMVQPLVRELLEAGLIVQVYSSGGPESTTGSDGDLAHYQPAVDIQRFTLHYVIDKLDQRGERDLPMMHSVDLERMAACLQEFSETLEHSPANLLLQDL